MLGLLVAQAMIAALIVFVMRYPIGLWLPSYLVAGGLLIWGKNRVDTGRMLAILCLFFAGVHWFYAIGEFANPEAKAPAADTATLYVAIGFAYAVVSLAALLQFRTRLLPLLLGIVAFAILVGCDRYSIRFIEDKFPYLIPAILVVASTTIAKFLEPPDRQQTPHRVASTIMVILLSLILLTGYQSLRITLGMAPSEVMRIQRTYEERYGKELIFGHTFESHHFHGDVIIDDREKDVGRSFVFRADDFTVEIETASGPQEYLLASSIEHLDYVLYDLTPDLQFLITAENTIHDDCRLTLWHLENGLPTNPLPFATLEAECNHLAISPDSTRLVVTTKKDLRLWKLHLDNGDATAEPTAKTQNPQFHESDVAGWVGFLNDQYIVSVDPLVVWNAETLQSVRTFRAIDPDETITLSSENHNAYILEIEDFSQFKTISVWNLSPPWWPVFAWLTTFSCGVFAGFWLGFFRWKVRKIK